MRSSGIEPKRIRFVSKLKGGVPWLILVEGKKGARPFMTVEENLFVYNDNGEYSDEISGIYGINKEV